MNFIFTIIVGLLSSLIYTEIINRVFNQKKLYYHTTKVDSVNTANNKIHTAKMYIWTDRNHSITCNDIDQDNPPKIISGKCKIINVSEIRYTDGNNDFVHITAINSENDHAFIFQKITYNHGIILKIEYEGEDPRNIVITESFGDTKVKRKRLICRLNIFIISMRLISFIIMIAAIVAAGAIQ